jgi:hypothetical protein
MEQSKVYRHDSMTDLIVREDIQKYIDKYYGGEERHIVHTLINNWIDEMCTCTDEEYVEYEKHLDDAINRYNNE